MVELCASCRYLLEAMTCYERCDWFVCSHHGDVVLIRAMRHHALKKVNSKTYRYEGVKYRRRGELFTRTSRVNRMFGSTVLASKIFRTHLKNNRRAPIVEYN